MSFNSNYPSIEALKARAKQRMPGFAYDYLDGGCFSEVNLQRNTSDIRDVQLKPYYLRDYAGASQKTELFGKTYDAPFGIAPVGLQKRLLRSPRAMHGFSCIIQLRTIFAINC
jgi:L-lactate dehydrogenase (cytochrome)